MNHITYRAYYEYKGRSHSAPFRTQKSDQEVAEALGDFLTDLHQFLPDPEAVITPMPQPDPNSSYVTISSTLDPILIETAVKNCLNSFDLYGEKISNSAAGATYPGVL